MEPPTNRANRGLTLAAFGVWRTLDNYYLRLHGLTNFLLKEPQRARIPGPKTIADIRREQHKRILDVQSHTMNQFGVVDQGADKLQPADINRLEDRMERLRALEAPFHQVQPATAYLGLEQAAARLRQVASSEPDAWEHVTTVHVEATGNSNYVVMRDAIGNWQIKRVKNDATELVRFQYNSMLAALELATSAGSGGGSAFVREAYKGFIDDVKAGGTKGKAFDTLIGNLEKARKAELDGAGNDTEARRKILERYEELLQAIYNAAISTDEG